MESPVPATRRAWWMVLALGRVPLEVFRVLLLPKLPLAFRRRYWQRSREAARSTPESVLLGAGRVRSCVELAGVEVAEGNLRSALTHYAEAVGLRTSNPETPLSVTDSWWLMRYADLMERNGGLVEARRLWHLVAEFPAGNRSHDLWCQRRARDKLGG